MTDSTVVGSVAGIWRFPIKSMKGERLEHGMFTERGLVGDRAYALIDAETGKVVSAKSVRLFPEIYNCRAEFVEPAQSDAVLPPVRITLPDGATVSSDSGNVDAVLSSSFGRDVTLAQAAPDDFTIDQYHPDIEDADPRGHRDAVVEQKLGAALFAEIGVPSPSPDGAFFDLFPLTLLTAATVNRLNELAPDSNFDERRFRMNLTIDTKEAGFVENDWIGHELALGDAMRIHVAMPDPRCVMTTLAQDELPRDDEILRTLIEHNRLQVGDTGLFPCAGVYAVVQVAGSLRTGDSVTLT
jgi:uncharacterized protein YcbX